MFRSVIFAATLPLTAAQADSLADRVHAAAVTACAVESSASLPASHYAAITQTCISRVSATAMYRLQMAEQARTRASTAALD